MDLSAFQIDLHTHSDFSPDGRGTPEAIVRSAAARGASLFSLTDHNDFGGVARAQQEAQAHGLAYLSGAEFDLGHPATGRGYHFLFYGFDPLHPGLIALARQQTAIYEDSFLAVHPYLEAGLAMDLDILREGLSTRYPGNPQPGLNQWYAAEWLVSQGRITDRKMLWQEMAAIREREPAARFAGRFSDFEDGLAIAREAGAKVVLAHVARYFPGDVSAQIALIEQLLEEGIDGFELHHPSNREEPDFVRLADAAKQLGCLVTAGSDTHDALGQTQEIKPEFGAMEVEEWLYARLHDRFGLK